MLVTYIRVFHVLEQSQLSVSAFGEQSGLERPVELLDGHTLSRLMVSG